VLSQRVDVSKVADIEAMARATVDKFGVPHFVFNNAGVGGGGLIWETSLKDWEWVLGVNVMGVVYGVRSFLPHMRAHGEGGHIVNTASMAGMINGMGFSPYAATKFAVVAMSEGLALQLQPLGIGVSVLCPEYVRTGIGASGRNRPDRYGKVPALDPASPAAELVAEIARKLEAGLDPAEVARRVVAAICNEELYIFTHPNMREGVDQRFAAIQAAMDKVTAP